MNAYYFVWKTHSILLENIKLRTKISDRQNKYLFNSRYALCVCFFFLCSSGGVVLASEDGKIVLENTLDARLDVIFRQKLPEACSLPCTDYIVFNQNI